MSELELREELTEWMILISADISVSRQETVAMINMQ